MKYVVIGGVGAVLAAFISTAASAGQISSPVGQAMQDCITQAIQQRAFAKDWIAKNDDDSDRHNTIYLSCGADPARSFWIELGRLGVQQTKSEKSHDGFTGHGRWFGNSSVCVHYDQQANGDPIDDFTCIVSLDVLPDTANAF
ncbi:hypothetical protein [Mesorhizobium sp.]|uniref:hypothetical protein n=1 Tax=Mesorhizobium sp. TaxID=1871066 RepID=UPI003BADB17B